jgi:phage terminase Nu1 subunit (DNA packaging protein)
MSGDKKKDPPSIETIIAGLEQATQADLRNILAKLQRGEALSAHERKRLDDSLAKYRAQQSGVGSRIVASQKEVAEYLGKGVRTIAYWKAKGMPVNPDGTYDLDSIDAWMDARVRKGIGQPHGEAPESGDKRGWEAIYKEMKARIAELDLQERQGQLISLEEVRSQWVSRIIEVKTALLGLPRKLPPLLAGKEKRDIEAVLEAELRYILERFSRSGGHLAGE